MTPTVRICFYLDLTIKYGYAGYLDLQRTGSMSCQKKVHDKLQNIP